MPPAPLPPPLPQAMEDGETLDAIYEYTKIDPWFLAQVCGGMREQCRRGDGGSEGRSAYWHQGSRATEPEVPSVLRPGTRRPCPAPPCSPPRSWASCTRPSSGSRPSSCPS